jgi:hypothetical protein
MTFMAALPASLRQVHFTHSTFAQSFEDTVVSLSSPIMDGPLLHQLTQTLLRALCVAFTPRSKKSMGAPIKPKNLFLGGISRISGTQNFGDAHRNY